MFAKTITRYYITPSSSSTTINLNLGTEAAIWLIIAAVLALVGGILIYALFVRGKKGPNNGFLLKLKAFLDFKIMWIEAFAKIAYYILTIFVVLGSFALIGESVLAFFLALILGPVVVRITYEAVMMGIMIWKNTKTIAESTQKK